jgi:hypothetical protein
VADVIRSGALDFGLATPARDAAWLRPGCVERGGRLEGRDSSRANSDDSSPEWVEHAVDRNLSWSGLLATRSRCGQERIHRLRWALAAFRSGDSNGWSLR